jgi:DNA-binding winged helix-turn-helix (wHTH) protein
MTWRRRWGLPVFLGVILLAFACLFAVRDVSRYGAGVWQTLRTSCLRRAAAFEASAEEWIVRDDLRSLDAASKLLLMGSGLYVDVVVRGESIMSGADEGIAVEAIDAAADPPSGITAQQRSGAVEILAPIALAGYPDTAIGFFRVGFSDDYAADRVWRRALIAGAVAAGCLLTCVCGIAFAVARRARQGDQTAGSEESVLCCGPLEIDRRSCDVQFHGKSVDLTPKLFELLNVFAQSPGTVFSDDELLQAVWSDSAYAASSDVKQHIYLLRRKFADVHSNPKALIENVKGFGYRLVPTANEKELSAH